MNVDAKRLMRLFRTLPPEARRSLLDYAEFLATRASAVVPTRERPVPRDIPRPGNESVVKAIRRLRETYFMLEGKALFHEASALMTRHVMQGVPAGEVIDELEVVFRRHYEKGIPDSQ
jgi:hypothetical protein